MSTISKLSRRLGSVVAVTALVAAMGGTWMTSSAAVAAPATPAAVTHAATTGAVTGAGSGSADAEHPAHKSAHRELTGKLNLNTATEEQLSLLPTVGEAKAERVIAWRKKSGGFKRVADLRHVKGFGYRTLKRLEPYLDIKGDTTLAQK